jgi:hypothetical protein
MAVLVTVEGATLGVRMTGLDQIWALRRHLEVPLTEVSRASVEAKDPLLDRLAFRIRCSSIPGMLTAGSYTIWKEHRQLDRERQFWLTKRGDEVLVVATGLRAPSLIVLQIPRCREVAALINEAVATTAAGPHG